MFRTSECCVKGWEDAFTWWTRPVLLPESKSKPRSGQQVARVGGGGGGGLDLGSGLRALRP